MTQAVLETKSINSREIEEFIATAIKKAGVKNEKELSRFIPVSSGGYIHHFTLKKMKKKQPQELKALIEKHVINPQTLHKVAPKTRAPRGSRKRRDQISFSRDQLERMLQMARQAGDKDMVAALSPKRPLVSYKRELIASIRHNRIELELWNAYIEANNAQQASSNSPYQANS